MKTILALLFLMLPVRAFALDYFGDLSSNELIMDITQAVHVPETGVRVEFRYRIELVDGVPTLTRTKPSMDKPTRGTLEIVKFQVLDEMSKATGEHCELVFTFASAGWSQDKRRTVFRIPYEISVDDPSGHLQLAESGTMESCAWDPKNGNVAVVTGQRFSIKNKVEKYTLGFGNKPLGKQ